MSMRFPSGPKIPTLSRWRSRTLAARPAPIALPRIADQPFLVADDVVAAAAAAAASFSDLCSCCTFESEGREEETTCSLSTTAPETYSSRNARLYSAYFHSPRKPSVPMLKDRIGGTRASAAKRNEACRMVPSPPKVETRSTLRDKSALALPLPLPLAFGCD